MACDVGAVFQVLGRGWCDAYVGEIGFFSGEAPEADGAVEIFALQAIDNQAWFG
jgi:hypothetical protein